MILISITCLNGEYFITLYQMMLNILSLKYNFILTSFGSTVKCGFPVKSLEKYLYLFNKENIMLIEEDVIFEKIVIDV